MPTKSKAKPNPAPVDVRTDAELIEQAKARVPGIDDAIRAEKIWEQSEEMAMRHEDAVGQWMENGEGARGPQTTGKIPEDAGWASKIMDEIHDEKNSMRAVCLEALGYLKSKRELGRIMLGAIADGKTCDAVRELRYAYNIAHSPWI